MRNFQIVVEHLVNYVERKAEGFLKKHGLESAYTKLNRKPKKQLPLGMVYVTSTIFLTQ